jgi:hypothetical protein
VKNDPHESLKFNKAKANWHQAPAVIVVLGDGRRQWGTVQGAHTFGRDQSHLTDGLANASFLIHLAIASLGLTSEWVSIHIQEPYKRILGIPDLLMVYLIIPIGHPDVPAREGVRRPLADLVHRERYDMSKYMTNEQVIRYLYSLREATVPCIPLPGRRPKKRNRCLRRQSDHRRSGAQRPGPYRQRNGHRVAQDVLQHDDL